jgi:predicted RNase H-like HicB family nuclease
MTTIEATLMKRDGYTREEARETLQEARERVLEGENPEDILYEDFGLEPDYIWELI